MASAVRSYAKNRLAWAHTDIFKAGLDPFSGWIYTYLAARADETGKTFPNQDTISAECGVSERQVRNCIAKLIEKKLLVVIQRSGGGRKSIYYLPSRNQWIADQVEKLDQPAHHAGCSEGGNRHTMPVEPAHHAGSLIEELNPKNLIQNSSFEVPSKLPKGKKQKHADPKQLLATFPEQFRQDDDFVEAFTNWAADRIDKKNPLTDRGCAIARNKLIKFPVIVAIKALERATEAGWSGVFPESIGKGGKSDKFEAASSDQPANDWFGS
jgi:hypothetical protein